MYSYYTLYNQPNDNLYTKTFQCAHTAPVGFRDSKREYAETVLVVTMMTRTSHEKDLIKQYVSLNISFFLFLIRMKFKYNETKKLKT